MTLVQTFEKQGNFLFKYRLLFCRGFENFKMGEELFAINMIYVLTLNLIGKYCFRNIKTKHQNSQ